MSQDSAASPGQGRAPEGGQFDRDFLAQTAVSASTDQATKLALSKGVEAWRTLRIQGEFVNSFDVLAELGPAIAVFGSARLGEGTTAYEQAQAVGAGIAQAGYAVITGGGPGTMHGANRGASDNGGTSVGLGIQLPFEDDFNDHVQLSVAFHYFFTRKVTFVKYSCGAVFCSGGLGTLDEFFEVMTLLQTGKVSDYPVALVGVDFWTPLLDWMRTTLLAQGTISVSDLEHLLLTDDAADAVAHVTSRSASPSREEP